MRSEVTFKCIKGNDEQIVTRIVDSLNEVDETSNILELIYELRNEIGYDRIKYLTKRSI